VYCQVIKQIVLFLRYDFWQKGCITPKNGFIIRQLQEEIYLFDSLVPIRLITVAFLIPE
jgi:hypothetical protein